MNRSLVTTIKALPANDPLAGIARQTVMLNVIYAICIEQLKQRTSLTAFVYFLVITLTIAPSLDTI